MMEIASDASLESHIKAQAYGLGFDLVGITRLGPASTAEKFENWLDRGFAGEMAYMERGRAKRRDSRLPFPGVQTAIVVALNYGGTQPPGPIARYARGRDYHDVIETKLRTLLGWIRETQRPVHGKVYVDTGPLLERDLARAAGLGWFGKNTNLINPGIGSFFFIGVLVTDLDLEADEPFAADRCGTCTRCLDACPTGAIIEEGIIDARRCISYLTIENRGPIAEEFRPLMGDLIYGCDICQDVCPWNERFARDLSEPDLAPDPTLEDPNLAELLLLTEEEFRVRFAHSPIKRTRRAGLARNIAIALGNRRAPGDAEALQHAVRNDPDRIVRDLGLWGLRQIERHETEKD